MATSLRISIPQPCHEDWQKMAQAEKGRFCGACQKVVVDFTKLTDQQILNYFSESDQNTCGRFSAGQLSRDIIVEKQHLPKFNYRFFTAMSLLLGLSMPVMAVDDTAVETKEYILSEDIPTTTDHLHDTFNIIRGRVTDSATQEALIGAGVWVKGTAYGDATDFEGYFEVKIPKNYGHEVTLMFNYVGYQGKEIKIQLVQNQFTEIQLSEAEIDLGGEVIIVAGVVLPKKETFFGRIKRFLRKIF